jgi:hypothetical protein
MADAEGSIPKADRQDIIRRLEAKGVKGCSACDTGVMQVARYTWLDISADRTQRVIGAPALQLVAMVCTNCGYVALHALQELGL